MSFFDREISAVARIGINGCHEYGALFYALRAAEMLENRRIFRDFLLHQGGNVDRSLVVFAVLVTYGIGVHKAIAHHACDYAHSGAEVHFHARIDANGTVGTAKQQHIDAQISIVAPCYHRG